MQRVDHALTRFVGAMMPALPAEEQSSVDERQAEALHLAKSILANDKQTIESQDVNYISDLIKEKLRQDDNSPDQAIKYSNLYSRLLALPVIERKWAVLYLLFLLSDSHSEGPSDSETVSPRPTRTPPPHVNRAQTSYSSRKRSEIDQRMAVDGTSLSRRLSRLPAREVQHNADLDERPEYNGYNVKEDHGEATIENGPTFLEGIVRKNTEAQMRPSESALLRELPFTLQGLSSTNLIFTSTTTLSLPATLSLPLVSLLHTLAEPSLLYRSLYEFVQSRDEGLISQSLRAAIGIELRSYLGLIATLEGEIRGALASVKDTHPQTGLRKAGVTLKRCVIWTREATLGLRFMSLLAEESKSKKGGPLISMVHSFSTSYGDPYVSVFAERMLAHLTRPFYDMLKHWIYDGELSDPYHEFFVFERDLESKGEKGIDVRRVPATNVWEDKYKLHDDAVPSIITEEFAKKIFLIGKSLNFIRYGCRDSGWVEAYSKDASKDLRYGDTATLETFIDKAYKTTMARLIHLMNSKFNLFDHLVALKKYLLLGQGDFVTLLMETLSSILDRPGGSQYRHTLNGALEHAVRGSNAQYDSRNVLGRLDARLLEVSHGDIGWDVFTLEYRIDAPVDVVITSWASKQYLVAFNFLWRIKRVEFALGSTWRRCMTGARGVLGTVEDQLGLDWKMARCCIAEMIHFINQLQYYILFEVIEASWDQLQAAIAKPDCTLDDLIEAHTKYLQSITHKGLLGSTKSSITGTREDSFTTQLHYILKVILAYRDVVDGLYSFSIAESTHRQVFATKVETRTAQGKWGITEKDEEDRNSPSPFGRPSSRLDKNRGLAGETDSPVSILAGTGDDQMLPSLRTRLQELAVDFKGKVNTLLGDLMVQPDVDMRFLGVVMNFNDVYHPKKRKEKRTAGERGKEDRGKQEKGKEERGKEERGREEGEKKG